MSKIGIKHIAAYWQSHKISTGRNFVGKILFNTLLFVFVFVNVAVAVMAVSLLVENPSNLCSAGMAEYSALCTCN